MIAKFSNLAFICAIEVCFQNLVMLQSDFPLTYICLVESKGKSPIVGYCIFDIGQIECRVGQINDDLNYTKTLRLIFLAEPSRILLPKSSESTPLFPIIRDNFPSTEIHSDLM